MPQGAIEKVEIIRDGKVMQESNKKAGTWIDRDIKPGRNWYYLRLKEKGQHMKYPHNVAPAWGKWAWSSPVSVTINDKTQTGIKLK